MFSNAASSFRKSDGDAATGEETEAKEGEEGEKEEASKPAATEEDREAAEKEQILAGVRKVALSMQTDIKDLLKNEWATNITALEG